MKYYLVASSTCCMVGIEQCVVYLVCRSRQAAFTKQFAGRILLSAASREALPAAPLRMFN